MFCSQASELTRLGLGKNLDKITIEFSATVTKTEKEWLLENEREKDFLKKGN